MTVSHSSLSKRDRRHPNFFNGPCLWLLVRANARVAFATRAFLNMCNRSVNDL
jgi:hypothetical protein